LDVSKGECEMKVNQSKIERVLRAILGIVLLGLYFTGIVAGGWAILLVVVGALALLTGLVGFCPLYALLKIDTNKS
jgi:hypothetical protein